jgi:hypothetical protein
MTVLFFDSAMPDDERRRRVFAGDLFVYSPTPRSLELCAFARTMAQEALSPFFPPEAQHHMDKQAYVDVLADLKPTFINHPRSKELVAGILADLRVDLADAYLDVPRLRTMTSDYLNAGLTLQFESHRDTWFSAPFSQINYWIPVYDVVDSNAMAFHPRYFTEPVRNSSRDYNYAQWVAEARGAAATQVEQETRKQPEAEQEIEREPDIRVIPPAGGILVFSGAQLHTTVPNTSGVTRFSIDFRVVNRQDVEAHRGAVNVDSASTGTNLGDFLRAADLGHLPVELIDEYDTSRV